MRGVGSQIFNAVAFLLGLLGVLVIYALVLGNVEAKTYEYAPCGSTLPVAPA